MFKFTLRLDFTKRPLPDTVHSVFVFDLKIVKGDHISLSFYSNVSNWFIAVEYQEIDPGGVVSR